MKLKLLPLALIVATLAMPPTAAAETPKSNGFTDQIRAAPADYTLEVYSRQLDFPSVILTSNPAMPDLITVGLPEQRAYDASSSLTAPMVVPDQEVSPAGDLAVAITSATRLHTRNKTQTTTINARSTMRYLATTTNPDATKTLVDYGIVNRC